MADRRSGRSGRGSRSRGGQRRSSGRNRRRRRSSSRQEGSKAPGEKRRSGGRKAGRKEEKEAEERAREEDAKSETSDEEQVADRCKEDDGEEEDEEDEADSDARANANNKKTPAAVAPDPKGAECKGDANAGDSDSSDSDEEEDEDDKSAESEKIKKPVAPAKSGGAVPRATVELPPRSTPDKASAPAPDVPSLKVDGCSNKTVRDIVEGNYHPHSQNHGKPVWMKDGLDRGSDFSVLIYFWDSRDGQDVCGWWLGPEVGGDQVWAYHPTVTSGTPPQTGWSLPLEGCVDMGFRVSVVPGTATKEAEVVEGASVFEIVRKNNVAEDGDEVLEMDLVYQEQAKEVQKRIAELRSMKADDQRKLSELTTQLEAKRKQEEDLKKQLEKVLGAIKEECHKLEEHTEQVELRQKNEEELTRQLQLLKQEAEERRRKLADEARIRKEEQTRRKRQEEDAERKRKEEAEVLAEAEKKRKEEKRRKEEEARKRREQEEAAERQRKEEEEKRQRRKEEEEAEQQKKEQEEQEAEKKRRRKKDDDEEEEPSRRKRDDRKEEGREDRKEGRRKEDDRRRKDEDEDDDRGRRSDRHGRRGDARRRDEDERRSRERRREETLGGRRGDGDSRRSRDHRHDDDGRDRRRGEEEKRRRRDEDDESEVEAKKAKKERDKEREKDRDRNKEKERDRQKDRGKESAKEGKDTKDFESKVDGRNKDRDSETRKEFTKDEERREEEEEAKDIMDRHSAAALSTSNLPVPLVDLENPKLSFLEEAAAVKVPEEVRRRRVEMLRQREMEEKAALRQEQAHKDALTLAEAVRLRLAGKSDEASQKYVEEQTALSARVGEQQATMNIVRAIKELSEATPDTFGRLKKELEDTLAKERIHAGSQWDSLKAEADTVLGFIHEDIERQIREEAEEKMKKQKGMLPSTGTLESNLDVKSSPQQQEEPGAKEAEKTKVKPPEIQGGKQEALEMKEDTPLVPPAAPASQEGPKKVLEELVALVQEAKDSVESAHRLAEKLTSGGLPVTLLSAAAVEAEQVARMALKKCARCADFIAERKPLLDAATVMQAEIHETMAAVQPQVQALTRHVVSVIEHTQAHVQADLNKPAPLPSNNTSVSKGAMMTVLKPKSAMMVGAASGLSSAPAMAPVAGVHGWSGLSGLAQLAGLASLAPGHQSTLPAALGRAVAAKAPITVPPPMCTPAAALTIHPPRAQGGVAVPYQGMGPATVLPPALGHINVPPPPKPSIVLPAKPGQPGQFGASVVGQTAFAVDAQVALGKWPGMS